MKDTVDKIIRASSEGSAGKQTYIFSVSVSAPPVGKKLAFESHLGVKYLVSLACIQYMIIMWT